MFNIFNYLKYSMIVDFMGTFLIQYDLFYFFCWDTVLFDV